MIRYIKDYIECRKLKMELKDKAIRYLEGSRIENKKILEEFNIKHNTNLQETGEILLFLLKKIANK